jgi:hypothetical protein
VLIGDIFVRRTLTATALFLATVPGIAHAAEPPCLTAAEFSGVASYGLPSVISGAALRCSATLPANSYLRSNSSQLAARYATGKPAAWPVAKGVFLKMSASTDGAASEAIARMPDPSLQTMFDAMIEGMVSQQIPTGRCTTIDSLVRLLAPLPPQNMAELIAIAAGLGAKSGKAKAGPFSICPA